MTLLGDWSDNWKLLEERVADGFVDKRGHKRKVAISFEPADFEAINMRAWRKGTSFAAEARALIARGLEADTPREAAE